MPNVPQTLAIVVPRPERQAVLLREILDSQWFRHQVSRMQLPLAVGKTMEGEPAIVDLATAPHLIIGGSTGQGKSAALNALLASLMFTNDPLSLRIIGIDPQRVELAVYKQAPHVHTIAREPEEIRRVLLQVKAEMDRRYARFEEMAVKTIEEHNALVPPERRLPRIVVVVDELAELMVSNRKAGQSIRDTFISLASMARKCGIHLVLATQSPRAEVIDGQIKANIDPRIALKVTSQDESRIILGDAGAESLVGKGDMLLRLGGQLTRVQGSFVELPQIVQLIEWWKGNWRWPYAVPPLLPSVEETAVVEAAPPGDVDVRLVAGEPAAGAQALPGGPAQEEKPWRTHMWRCATALAEQGSGSIPRFQAAAGCAQVRAAHIVSWFRHIGILGVAQGSTPGQLLVPAAEVDGRIKEALRELEAAAAAARLSDIDYIVAYIYKATKPATPEPGTPGGASGDGSPTGGEGA